MVSDVCFDASVDDRGDDPFFIRRTTMKKLPLPSLLLASLLAAAPLAFAADQAPPSPAPTAPRAAPVLLSDAQMDSVSAGAATSLQASALIRFMPGDPIRPVFIPNDPVRILRF
jgi:hypothetical protein